jgi:hypothetical protein
VVDSLQSRILKVAASIIVALCCAPFALAKTAETLDDYIAALNNDLRSLNERQTERRLTIGHRPSLDARRLLQHSYSLIHAASPAQKQRLSEAITALVPHHVVPATASPIPMPLEYLAFTEVHVVHSEILDRMGYTSRADMAKKAGDNELRDAALGRLCSAPSTIDFYRRVLDGELAAGRYPVTAVSEARAVSARLAARVAWYASATHQSTCRDLSRVRVAP